MPKISQLTASGSVAAGSLLAVVEGGVTKKATIEEVLASPLTAAATAQATADSALDAVILETVTISASTLTWVRATHNCKRLRCTNAAGCVITVNDSAAPQDGDRTQAYASVSGQQVTWAQAGSHVIQSNESLKTRKQYSLSELQFESATLSLLTGDLELT